MSKLDSVSTDSDLSVRDHGEDGTMKLTGGGMYELSMPSLRRYDIAAKAVAEPETLADMTDDQHREYMRQKKAESRERQKKAAAEGAVRPTTEAVRDALADAALMLLAVDGPGSAEIRNVLARVFAARPGVVLKVSADAKRGKLRPRLLKP
jgi:hypothetical protein